VSGWGADRRPAWQGEDRWRIPVVNFEAAFRSALAGSGRILSGHGELK